jgi:hypothetical protein
MSLDASIFEILIDGLYRGWNDEHERARHLANAAPELLEALEMLIAPDNGQMRAAEIKANFAKAKAAIRKAKEGKAEVIA